MDQGLAPKQAFVEGRVIGANTAEKALNSMAGVYIGYAVPIRTGRAIDRPGRPDTTTVFPGPRADQPGKANTLSEFFATNAATHPLLAPSQEDINQSGISLTTMATWDPTVHCRHYHCPYYTSEEDIPYSEDQGNPWEDCEHWRPDPNVPGDY
ncbi:Uu.00g142200.m01.CDS01 [Anthostomella pinea]|uniref:Uu.00g142200.m01.CDS01 n=1 Tax=Anthostomella pinea TaxID=933095 RepID=A0AAI8VR84_9PEZI|nr:Uu.00g142200.m01.CDS01 [Anthostomella pinea]